MAEDPNLNGLNDKANADPIANKVETQRIKNASDPIGGVDVGAIDKVPLIDESDTSNIETAVEQALAFKPNLVKSPAVLAAAARIRQDFININQYVTARNRVSQQIEQLLRRRGGGISAHASAQLENINAIIMERTIGTRLDDANKVRQSQLGVSENILKFHTTSVATYMRQSLALQYRQVFAIKNLLTMTKAFADMAENKLDAIKINTKLPDIKKKSLIDEVKTQIQKKIVTAGGKAAVEFLSHETTEDMKNQLRGLKDKATGFINKARDFTKPKAASLDGPKTPLRQRIREGLEPENLWKTTKLPREFVADLIKHSTNKKSPQALLTDILAKLSAQLENNNMSPMMAYPQALMMPSTINVPGSSQEIIERLVTIGKNVTDFHGSFDQFKTIYEKNFTQHYDILKNIDTTLIKMPSMAVGQGGPSDSNAPQTADRNFNSDDRIGTGIHIQKKYGFLKLIPWFIRPKTYIFTDVYLKDNVNPGYPLVSKEQFDRGSVTRADGKPVKTLNDITVPILDIATGLVLISDKDIKTGLVDVNNKSLKLKSGLFDRGLISGFIKIPFVVANSYARFLVKGVGAAGDILFRKRDKSPYADVYIKGNIKPGKPLITTSKFREGLIFADGSRVLNVNQIDQPVLDPKTGQTLISEEDLQQGLVDVFGDPISKRKASFSTIGGIFDISKYGIKTAGGLAKPVLGMYAEMFKMLPKAVLGVGNLLSKSIIGIFSGNAPGALAKGLVGITGSITKMYAQMFGLGIKGIGGIFGKLFGGGKKKSPLGDVSKKDIYDLISVRLDHIYTLLDSRLANDNIRSGSYQDHENQLKKDREKLLHVKEQEELSGGKGKSVISRLAGIFGLGGVSATSDEDTDGSEDDTNKKDQSGNEGIIGKVEDGAELAAGSVLASKIPGVRSVKRIIPGLKNLASRGFKSATGLISKFGKSTEGAVEGIAFKTGVDAVAEDLMKIGSKISLKDAIKLGGKSILKKIPGIGAIAGLGFAADDLYHGDAKAAAGDAASGLVSVVPFVGTAASVAIDGYMAYNTFHKATGSSISKLLKARLKVYGVDESKVDITNKLEQRMLQIVISNGGHKFTTAEAADYAKQFGMDPTDKGQFQYFCNWLDNRFRNGYLVYLVILKKYRYDISQGDSVVREKDMNKIISEYVNDTATLITKYSQLIPTITAYKTSPQAKAEKTVTSIAPFQQNQSPEVQPTTTAQSNNLPITQTAYMVPNQQTRAVRSLQNYPTNNLTQQTTSIATDVSNNNQPSIQTQMAAARRSYVRQSYNRSSGYNTTAPGAIQGGIQPSIAQINASARSSYTTAPGSSPNGGSLPTGHNYYNAMYQLLYKAAQAQGVPNPAVVAQLGAAQSALETGNGQHVPGGNYFGIKSSSTNAGTSQNTQEFVNGRMITENQNFRSYSNPSQSASDYIKFLKTNPRYQGVLAATNISDAVAAQARSGYATDPSYGAKLASIVNSHPSPGSSPVTVEQPTQIASNIASTTDTSPSTQVADNGPATSPLPQPANNNQSVPQATPDASSNTPMYVPAAQAPQVQNAAYVPSPNLPYRNNGYPQATMRYNGGPGSNIINPIRTAVGLAETVQNGVAAITNRRNLEQHPPQFNVQATLPPELLVANQQQALVSQQALDVMGGMHNTMKGVLGHLQQVHSPNGVMGQMADNIANNQPQSPIIAPTVNMPDTQKQNNNCQDNVGFSVKKKRDNRYSA